MNVARLRVWMRSWSSMSSLIQMHQVTMISMSRLILLSIAFSIMYKFFFSSMQLVRDE